MSVRKCTCTNAKGETQETWIVDMKMAHLVWDLKSRPIREISTKV